MKAKQRRTAGRADLCHSDRGEKWWARLVSNQRPLRCQHSALPLSYAPTPGVPRRACRPAQVSSLGAGTIASRTIRGGDDRWLPRPGFTVGAAAHRPGPLVLASPHSGRDYPAPFLAATRLTLPQLRRAEDAYRRRPDRAGRGGARRAAGRRALGPGVARSQPRRRRDRPGDGRRRDAGRSGAGERARRRRARRHPAHRRHMASTSTRAAAPCRDRRAHRRRPCAVPCGARRPAGGGGPRQRVRHPARLPFDADAAGDSGGAPQIVIGDRFGASAAPALVAAVERHFAAAGFRVARNVPYAGGYTTAHHGRPASGVHAVQIEIDRALYMDPARLVRHAGFDRVAAAFDGAGRDPAGHRRRRSTSGTVRLAAE